MFTSYIANTNTSKWMEIIPMWDERYWVYTTVEIPKQIPKIKRPKIPYSKKSIIDRLLFFKCVGYQPKISPHLRLMVGNRRK